MLDGEPDWRDWTDQGPNRREAVVLRARQILSERTGSTPAAESEPGTPRMAGPSGASAAAAAPAGTDDVPF